MSKRVQRYECGECERTYADKERADECERHHDEDRKREACEQLSREIHEELWMLTLPQLAEVMRMVKLMQAANNTPHTSGSGK